MQYPTRSIRTRSHRSRRGVMAILVVASISIFALMVALSVDVGYMQLSRLELRASADSAAKAGAEALVREDSTAAAIAAAKQLAAVNHVGGEPVILADEQIQFGRSLRQSDGSWLFTANATPFDSVRVLASQPVSLFFGGVTGTDVVTTDVQSTAAFTESEICLVVDRSHSMCFDLTGIEFSYPAEIPPGPSDPVIFPPHHTHSRWAYLEQAVEEFITVLENRSVDTRVGMVSFGSLIDGSTYEGALTGQSFPAVSLDVAMGTDLQPIQGSVQQRGTNVMLGGTNMSGGMDAGITMLTGTGALSYAHKTMIVMTDGKWNMGIDPTITAQVAKNNNITIHTVTFLDSANQADMVTVATIGGGHHYHASNSIELIAAFRELASNLPVTLID